MEENQSTSMKVKDAIHKLLLSLLDGIQNEDQLFAAGSLMSRGDYQDVVVERSIAKLCGYPLGKNSLPSDQPRNGRYRISLKEHKVYDQQETYRYCSSSYLVNSRAFGGSLQEEQSMVPNPAKLAEILRLVDKMSLGSAEGMGKNGDLGMSNLMIQEKAETVTVMANWGS
ncbi:unnamed protein product [Linum trigynum]|uniref:RNA polymerase II subunit B1 CTD phosphatase RPAP2 homolog n=1 Tax=Linum trigynum TaxID=586398 RepID=A0AAV2ETL9_9ROSI